MEVWVPAYIYKYKTKYYSNIKVVNGYDGCISGNDIYNEMLIVAISSILVSAPILLLGYKFDYGLVWGLAIAGGSLGALASYFASVKHNGWKTMMDFEALESYKMEHDEFVSKLPRNDLGIKI